MSRAMRHPDRMALSATVVRAQRLAVGTDLFIGLRS